MKLHLERISRRFDSIPTMPVHTRASWVHILVWIAWTKRRRCTTRPWRGISISLVYTSSGIRLPFWSVMRRRWPARWLGSQTNRAWKTSFSTQLPTQKIIMVAFIGGGNGGKGGWKKGGEKKGRKRRGGRRGRIGGG